MSAIGSLQNAACMGNYAFHDAMFTFTFLCLCVYAFFWCRQWTGENSYLKNFLSMLSTSDFYQCVGQARSHETITFLLVTLPNIQRFKKNFTHRLNNKPFLICLLTTPTHLKYVATLPCNFSLMACFTDINVSQGSVATYARRGGIFNIHLTTHLPRNLPVKKILKSV